jgi:SpoVK/Ycf46/Vps4 family AAA+-type ATPase
VLDPLRTRAFDGSPNTQVSRQGGYLMFGPPGCGKGFFARVVAGEIGAAYLPIKLGTALEWPGDPRQNIQKIFEAAREASPCVVFLDDVDQAGRNPDAPEDSVDRGIVNRLVTELDTAAADSGVYVFAGAVAPWDVDMALRADGRLDRTLLVLPPDEAAREAILRFHLKNTPLAGVDVSWIVQRTQHFSGDDLLLLCETASQLAAAEALGGRSAIGPGHVTRALREVRPTAPAWFSTVMDRAITSNHGGIYDEAIAYIDEHQLV